MYFYLVNKHVVENSGFCFYFNLTIEPNLHMAADCLIAIDESTYINYNGTSNPAS